MKLLGVNIENRLKFDRHICNISLEGNIKLGAIAGLSRFLLLENQLTLLKAFIKYQLKYCLLVWMFHGSQKTHKNTRLKQGQIQKI